MIQENTMNGKLTVCLLVVGLVAAMAATEASAHWPCHAAGGWAYWPGSYSGEYVPYFAKHPPVYYSYVVRRPYGLSPYPWPPVVRTGATAGTVKAGPIARNPFVVRTAAGKMPVANPYLVSR
jgi:hypothetical protein